MKKFKLLAILVTLGFLMASCSPALRQTTPPELTELMERLAIEELFYDYYAQFRSDSKHAFDTFFTADAHLDVNGFIVDGRENIKATYAGINAGGEEEEKDENTVPGGMGEASVTNLKIDLQGDKAVATFVWTIIMSDLVTTEPKVIEYGRERSELVKQDGRWLISSRVVLTEGGMPESLLPSYPKK